MNRVCSAVTALCLLTVVGCESSSTGPEHETITIGGLFSLTGNWSTLGATSKAALELAVEDINEQIGSGSPLHFRAQVEDTKLDPALARAAAKRLHDDAVEIAIGPQSSAEVEVLKPYADSARMLIVSQSSTAGSLAIPGDYILRFTPGDSLEAIALAALIRADGITTTVPLWRGDAGNRGLASATRARLTALGGTVTAGVEYSGSETNFAGALATIRAQVEAAIATGGTEKVAVTLAAFDEAVAIFNAARTDPVLSSVRWYGTDGTALSAALQSNAGAAAFAAQVGFPAPIFGLDDANALAWQPLAARIRDRAGIEPDAFALAVYDAAMLAAQAYLAVGGRGDPELLKTRMIAAAAPYLGATGSTSLNAAGDRSNGNFDFFALRAVDGGFAWERVAQFDTGTGVLRR